MLKGPSEGKSGQHDVTKNAFAYRGPVLWNALPENIKKCESLNGFKQCLKLHVV